MAITCIGRWPLSTAIMSIRLLVRELKHLQIPYIAKVTKTRECAHCDYMPWFL